MSLHLSVSPAFKGVNIDDLFLVTLAHSTPNMFYHVTNLFLVSVFSQTNMFPVLQDAITQVGISPNLLFLTMVEQFLLMLPVPSSLFTIKLVLLQLKPSVPSSFLRGRQLPLVLVFHNTTLTMAYTPQKTSPWN